MLFYASQQPGWTVDEGGQWGYLDGSGSQMAPCDRPPKKKRGFWEIDGEQRNKPHSNSRNRGLPDGKRK